MQNSKSIPPFFLGQEVVAIKSFESLRKYWKFNYPRKGDTVKIQSIRKHWRHNFWLIKIKGCGCELCHLCFAPITPKFETIEYKEVLEKEKEFVGSN